MTSTINSRARVMRSSFCWMRSVTIIAIALLAGCAQSARFATFNASLNRNKAGQLLLDLNRGDDPQIKNVAEIVQRTRPDVLLVNEFDYDPADRASRLFQQ